MKTKQLFFIAIALILALPTLAQEPDGYYDAAKNKKDKALLQALGTCIATSTKVSYDGLWDAYRTTDNNGGYYWDMYATTKFPLGQKHCGSYKNVGDCVNREHSFPKSWWGSTKDQRYSDLFHLYPTDGYVNNQRSAYPFGECANGTYLPTNGTNKPLGKLGACTFPTTYTGKVFEPDDEYKGDFARSYFYMAARYYSDGFSSWGGGMCGEENYLAYKDWAVTLLMKWHRQDPVSEKEINRNNAVYATAQNNRNPFIDHPELAEYIWGDKRGEVWSGEAVVIPTLTSPAQGEVIDFGIIAVNSTSPLQTITIKGTNLTKDLTLRVSGTNLFSLSGRTVTAEQANEGYTLGLQYHAPSTAESSTGTLTISSDEINVTVTLKGQSVTGIPALAATDITQTSFRANWTAIAGTSSTYQLHVLGDDGQIEISGYPKDVTAADGSALVTGLEPNTTYYYQLTETAKSSNVIEVTTLDVEKIISIQGDFDDLEIKAKKGQASPVVEAEVYTENITETVELTVSGNFEISLDKEQWAQELAINPEGETFFIRIMNTSVAGEYNGELNACTATLDGYNLDVTGIVIDPAAELEVVTEDWEGCETGGYWTKAVQGDKFSWNFVDAGIWGDPQRTGALSCRLGKTASSSIAMAEDYANGASGFSFLAAPFGSDADATLTVSYSVDEGATWETLETFTASAAGSQNAPAIIKAATGGMNLYSVSKPFNVYGKIRFKIAQSTGSRVNIDEISITSYNPSTAIESITSVAPAGTWSTWAGKGVVTIESGSKAKFEVYDLDARRVARVKVTGKANVNLAPGMYIVTDGKTSRKVIVK